MDRLVLEMANGEKWEPQTRPPAGINMHRVLVALRKLSKGNPNALDGLSQVAAGYVQAVAEEYDRYDEARKRIVTPAQA